MRIFLNTCKTIDVVLTELDENPSASVTNSIELLVDQLLQQEKIPDGARILEHYPAGLLSREEFSIVNFDGEGRPSWSRISLSSALKQLGCSEGEFGDYKQDARVRKEIQDALHGIPKIERFQYTEPVEITERRLEITRNQHSKTELKKLLAKHPSERELSDFLKEDLSLLAECYAVPDEEYVCFAEFPVGEGRVDFAVFTGRSRMSVYLIEIKGARDKLCRKNHYHEFRSSVQEGRGQLLERAAWCSRNYEKFRVFTHTVLKEVKKGNRPYGAFPGPVFKLEVDPNKDIELHYILIASRTGEDLPDSQKRHMEDSALAINIRTETWDSWLYKLRRD